MGVSWKKRFDPDVVLEKLSETVTKTGERIAFSGFDYYEYFHTLFTMLDFPESLPWGTRHKIARLSLNRTASIGDFSRDGFLRSINKELSLYLQGEERLYRLIAPVSLNVSSFTSRFYREELMLNFFSKLPAKYESRIQVQKYNLPKVELTPKKYNFIMSSVRALSIEDAFFQSVENINFYRGILCLLTNSRMEFGYEEWSPINKVRLGGRFSLHHERGAIASEVFWYDPDFLSADIYSVPIGKQIELRSNVNHLISGVFESPFKKRMVSALRRYVVALDSPNPHHALQLMWNALEILAAPNESNCDKMVSRVSFLFKDRKYHKQALEHLRDYRNAYVHRGEEGGNARDHCFQLQFYFFHFFVFYANQSKHFQSLSEINYYLDLPTETKKLKRLQDIISKAESYLA